MSSIVCSPSCVRALAVAAFVSASATASASASDGLPTALFTTGAQNALSVVPGSGGAVLTSVTQARLRLSRTGSWWALTAFATGQPSTNDTFILVGDGSGVVYAVGETTTLPGLDVGFTAIPNAQLGVNESGAVAFKATTTAASPSANDAVVKNSAAGGSFTVVALEGTPVPGIPGETFGGTMDSITLFDDGSVVHRASGTQGSLPSTADDLLRFDAPSSILLQAGSVVPTGQFGGTTAPIVGINDEAFVAEDRTSFLADVELGLSSNSRAFVVRNGTGPLVVAVQRGAPIPGLDGELPYSGGSPVDFGVMGPGGDWAVWGAGSGGTAYAIRNGELYLREGDPIPGGDPGETIVSIGHLAINSFGHTAWAATTTSNRTVIVVDRFDGAPTLAVRSFGSISEITTATQVDFDADGLLDDAFVGFVVDVNLGLADDGRLFFLARCTASATLLNVGDALIVVPTALSCPADLDASGAVDAADLAVLLGGWANPGPTDLDGNGSTGGEDLAVLLGAWGDC
jgi:hypothetical protein